MKNIQEMMKTDQLHANALIFNAVESSDRLQFIMSVKPYEILLGKSKLLISDKSHLESLLYGYIMYPGFHVVLRNNLDKKDDILNRMSLIDLEMMFRFKGNPMAGLAFHNGLQMLDMIHNTSYCDLLKDNNSKLLTMSENKRNNLLKQYTTSIKANNEKR